MTSEELLAAVDEAHLEYERATRMASRAIAHEVMALQNLNMLINQLRADASVYVIPITGRA